MYKPVHPSESFYSVLALCRGRNEHFIKNVFTYLLINLFYYMLLMVLTCAVYEGVENRCTINWSVVLGPFGN